MFCPHCGQQHPAGASFCPITGQPLTMMSQKPKSKTGLRIFFAALLVLGLILMAIGGILWVIPRLNLGALPNRETPPGNAVVPTQAVTEAPQPMPPLDTPAAQPTSANPPAATNPPVVALPPTATVRPVFTATPFPTNTTAPNYTPTPYCPGVSWSPRVKKGDTVKICTIYRLRLRDKVDGEDILFLLPMTSGTTILEIIDGPFCGEDAWWWEVKVPANSMSNNANTNPGAPVVYTTSVITGYVKEGLDRDSLPDSQGYYLCVQPKK